MPYRFGPVDTLPFCGAHPLSLVNPATATLPIGWPVRLPMISSLAIRAGPIPAADSFPQTPFIRCKVIGAVSPVKPSIEAMRQVHLASPPVAAGPVQVSHRRCSPDAANVGSG